MKPVDQTEFTALDESTHGNCLSACLASLLEVPLEGIPNFSEMGDRWAAEFYRILDEHGYEFCGTFYFQTGNKPTWDDLLKVSQGVDGYFIACGKSPREYVTRGHAVIYKDGKLAHDPHPSRGGLILLEDVLMVERLT